MSLTYKIYIFFQLHPALSIGPVAVRPAGIIAAPTRPLSAPSPALFRSHARLSYFRFSHAVAPCSASVQQDAAHIPFGAHACPLHHTFSVSPDPTIQTINLPTLPARHTYKPLPSTRFPRLILNLVRFSFASRSLLACFHTKPPHSATSYTSLCHTPPISPLLFPDLCSLTNVR